MSGNLTQYDFVKCGDCWVLTTQGYNMGLSDYKNEALWRNRTWQSLLDNISGGKGSVRIHTESSFVNEERTSRSQWRPLGRWKSNCADTGAPDVRGTTSGA